jgi:hypothetical protein
LLYTLLGTFKIMKKYNLLTRILLVAPVLIIMGFVWALIGLFSTKSLGKVLKQTGENLLNE